MGYDIHIRRGDWWEDGGQRIGDEEWAGVVDHDPELTMTGEVTASTPDGETLTYRNAQLAMWTGHTSGEPIPFDFRRGRVVVKNPDDSTLAKMIELAASLDAVVQGDDGETYP